MSRIRPLPLIVALAAMATISLSTAPAAHAIKATEAMDRAGSHCTLTVFQENGRAGVMIICGTFPFQTVIFCKGDDECYISRAPVQTTPTTRKPGQGAAVTDAQQSPGPDSPGSIPTRFPKEAVLAYEKRIGFTKVTADDGRVLKALEVKKLARNPSQSK